MTVRYFYYRNYPPRICIDLFYQFYKSDYAVDCTQRESSNILRSLEILLPRRLCKFQVAFFANGARAQPRVSAVHRVFLFLLFTLAWHSSLLERRIAIYNSRKWNYYSPRIENYHFSPIYFSRPPTRSLPVVHHFLEIRYLFFALSKNQEGNLFAQLFLSIIGIVPSSRTANFQPVTTDLLFRSRLDISTSFYTFEARSS